jgi:hypothetical protein
VWPPTGPVGTIHDTFSLVVNGATNQIRVDETILGGTGGFTGSHGRILFTGFENAGFGTYTDSWTRPATRSKHRAASRHGRA